MELGTELDFWHDIEMGFVLLSGDNNWFYVAAGRQKLAFILIIIVNLLLVICL